MHKLNVDDLPWQIFSSPKGRFKSRFRDISVAMGAVRDAPVEGGGHPFDLALETLGPGETACPYHDHAAQWEMFYILAGTGTVRAAAERHTVRAGDAILHEPGEAHQIVNTGTADLTYLIVANNPPLDVCRYPESGKIGIYRTTVPRDGMLVRTTDVDYWDGEE